MRNNYAKFITGMALLCILLLQGVWLYNAYKLVGTEIRNKVNDCLSESNEKEIFNRLNLALVNMPKGGVVSTDTLSGTNTTFAPDFIDVQESLVKLNKPLIMHNLDSLFSESLAKSNIDTKYVLNKINIKTGKVFETTDPSLKGELKGSLKSKVIPVNKEGTEGIQVLVISPYKAIFQEMILLLVGSVFMAVIIVFCIFLQIKVIIRQDKISQIRQDFTYAMIHDMKTPLSTIIIGLNILRSGKLEDKPDKKEKHFDVCVEESNRLLMLTNRVLTIARLEQDKLALNKQIVDLKSMVNSLVEKFTIKASKEVSFTTSFSENALFVVVDCEYFKEAVSNLIDNSIKYSREEVNINISCIKANDQITIKVRDNGLGIAHKDQAKIFEKFERAAAVGGKGGITGFGLGLNYVLRVVEAHGGTVSVSSVENEFSEFVINLPVLIEKL